MYAILETLFSSTARVQILDLFLQNPGSQFYQREIERQTGQPIRAVQREVERLEGVGLLRRSAEGNRVFYTLDTSCRLLPQLTALFRAAAGSAKMKEAREGKALLPPEPSTIRQPFPWMETLPIAPVTPVLRHLQMEGEWDRAY